MTSALLRPEASIISFSVPPSIVTGAGVGPPGAIVRWSVIPCGSLITIALPLIDAVVAPAAAGSANAATVRAAAVQRSRLIELPPCGASAALLAGPHGCQ